MRKPNPFDKVPQDSPVSPLPRRDADELDAFLDDALGEEGGIGDFTDDDYYDDDSPPYRHEKSHPNEVRGGQVVSAHCKHRGHALVGVPTLMGSSYRDGLLMPGNSVTVILTREALERAFPAGWASYASSEFNTHLRGAVIYWPWVDMKVPEDLEQAARRILELHRVHEAGTTIEVACYGGHGRTGTLLAVLAALHAEWPAQEAVSRFRDAYCHRAVESQEQELFVEQMIEIVRAMKAQG